MFIHVISCIILQIKTDEDEWLQEAMASLMYLPYIAGWDAWWS